MNNLAIIHKPCLRLKTWLPCFYKKSHDSFLACRHFWRPVVDPGGARAVHPLILGDHALNTHVNIRTFPYAPPPPAVFSNLPAAPPPPPLFPNPGSTTEAIHTVYSFWFILGFPNKKSHRNTEDKTKQAFIWKASNLPLLVFILASLKFSSKKPIFKSWRE